MAAIRAYHADDLPPLNSILHTPKRPRKRPETSQNLLSGRQSSLSLRSLPDDLDGPATGVHSGAEIRDIPLRRSSAMARAGLESSPHRRDITREKVFESNHEFILTHGGPINPNAIHKKVDKSTNGHDTERLLKRAMSLDIDDMTRSGARTPSTMPRSIRSVRSRANSAASSYQTQATSLPALQTNSASDVDGLEPLAEEFEPGSFDLMVPAHGDSGLYSLERRSELLFSKEHLQVIFDDPVLLQRFTTFLCSARPGSVPLLVYYLDALKALRAIRYANAVVEALEPLDGHEFTDEPTAPTLNESLAARADTAFEALAREDLPAYITHVWIQTVSLSIKRRITGTLPVHLRDMSEGLAEVFCLTDPSRHDNPIVLASEEFHRTTQYGMKYVIGRNCRFLQGPKTNPFSVKRIREKLEAGKEHCETFLNYRRDGSPFMNLLMVAPLYDSRGSIRYFLGAQVDVSGLAKDAAGLESLQRLTDSKEQRLNDAMARQNGDSDAIPAPPLSQRDEFRDLSEMFNLQELETVRRDGGTMHRLQHEEVQHSEATSNWHKPRVLIQDEMTATPAPTPTPTDGGRSAAPSVVAVDPATASGRLTGVYEHYLLVRPHPSLRVLFASPSLRVPGILQSHFLTRIGGAGRVRDELARALAAGSAVTARVRWVVPARSRSAAVGNGKGQGQGQGGRARWIHCTPLLGSNGAIGVWMIVIVEDEAAESQRVRENRDAPLVDPVFGLGLARHQHPDGHRTSTRLAHKPAADDTASLSSFAVKIPRLTRKDLEERRRRREAATPAPDSVSVDDGRGGEGEKLSSPSTLRLGDDD